MADIELVIRIPEDEYQNILHTGRASFCAVNAIEAGTVLPKGHGRIADMDEAIKCIEDVEGDDAIWAIALIEWACGKRTLIEADKTEGEEV